MKVIPIGMEEVKLPQFEMVWSFTLETLKDSTKNLLDLINK
jgi:hypothetical protein